MSLVRITGFAFLASLAVLGSMGAAAQVFRIVGPDGKVTFSDKPPTEKQAPARVAPSVALPAAAAAVATCPNELRTAVGKYPVTLYTSEGCGGPCAARAVS
jgi:hypothetical protein